MREHRRLLILAFSAGLLVLHGRAGALPADDANSTDIILRKKESVDKFSGKKMGGAPLQKSAVAVEADPASSDQGVTKDLGVKDEPNVKAPDADVSPKTSAQEPAPPTAVKAAKPTKAMRSAQTMKQSLLGGLPPADSSAAAPLGTTGADASRPEAFFPANTAATGLGGGVGGDMRPAARGATMSPGTKPPAGPAVRPAPDFTHPTETRSLALAEAAGFKPVFDGLGLKTALTPSGVEIVHRDGRPASRDEVSALARRIADSPVALTRRQDYFKILPREHYDELRAEYGTRPELQATTFKDVAATAGVRDFLWKSSCAGLSGDCNHNTAQPHYSKGAYVAPEDLERMWKDASAQGAAPAAERSASAAQGSVRGMRADAEAAGGPGATARLRAKLGAFLGRISGLLGNGSASSNDTAVYAAGGGGSGRSTFPAGAPTRFGSDVSLMSKMPPLPGSRQPEGVWARARRGSWMLLLILVASAAAVYLRRRAVRPPPLRRVSK